jgi:RNA polymerase sigma-70 factor (ECF subfamily)
MSVTAEPSRSDPRAAAPATVLATARPDEAQLLQRLRAGDDAAFEEMVRTYGGRLLAVARRLLGNEADAQDALQDGFVSALRALPTFRGECQLSTWLHRIVVNAALTQLRARRRHPEVSIEGLLPEYAPDGHHVTSFRPWTIVERTLIDAEARSRMRTAIQGLPETYRTVLLLRDVEDLDAETVARMLATTPGVVKTRLHRARQALVTLLTPVFAPAAAATPRRVVAGVALDSALSAP